MKPLHWSNSYHTGIDPVDEQNKRIYDSMGQIHEAISGGIDADVINEMITQLSSNCRVHLLVEHLVMDNCNCMTDEDHRNKYEIFAANLDKFSVPKHGNDRSAIRNDFVGLMNWYLSHIINDEIQYKQCLLKNE
jgi:hemerythrin-like metal-binding protein